MLLVPLYGLLGIDWQTCLNPRVESAVKRMNILPTTVTELLRHPGAGCFVRSSAVGYDRAVLWYLIEMFLDLIGRHAKSIRQFFIRLSPRRRIPCINERELFATIKTLSYFIRSDSCYFHYHLHYSTIYRNHL
jgi:hypothetical protein